MMMMVMMMMMVVVVVVVVIHDDDDDKIEAITDTTIIRIRTTMMEIIRIIVNGEHNDNTDNHEDKN